VVESVETFSVPDGAVRVTPVEDVGYRYRGSDLGEDLVVVAATVGLTPGDRSRIRALMDEAREWRRATQPLAEPNCGSVFKNPPGDHAARLIEALGAKGTAVGGASVSRKHANFIVAQPGARAADVVTLIRTLQEQVEERFSIRLDPEVQLVGRFDLAPL
jgi:UDP-N-acetylmuramate dehydrogenase